jgi:hypothetical protein
MPNKSLIVSVDRLEGPTVVFEGDDGRRFEVSLASLTKKPREGAVYSVPLDVSGEPLWKEAVSDHAETNRRRTDLKRRMAALRKRDSGGDVDL